MKPISYSLLYYCLILVQVLLEVCATCPKNALEQFQNCTQRVLPDLSQNSLSQGPASYTKQIKDASDSCRDSRLNDATHCITDILDRCNGNSDAEIKLRQLVDKDKTLGVVDYFCKNLRVYEKNAECIFRHHEEVNTCSENAMQTFKHKLKSGASFDMLISESCRFHSTARSCLTQTTELRCGQEAAEFVFQLLTGTMPPHCDTEEMVNDNPKYTPYDGTGGENGGRDKTGNSANTVILSNILTIVSMCLLIVLYKVKE